MDSTAERVWRLVTEDFAAECVFIVVTLVYVVNLWLGTRSRRALTAAWTDEASKALQHHFAVVDGVEVDTSTCVTYASGRDNCQSWMARVEWRPRHDLFLGVLWPRTAKDFVAVHLTLPPALVGPCVFMLLSGGVGAESALDDAVKSRYDLTALAQRMSRTATAALNFDSDGCCGVADGSGVEVATRVFNDAVLQAALQSLRRMDAPLQQVLVTDMPAVEPSTAVSTPALPTSSAYIKLVFGLPSSADQVSQCAGDIVELSLYVVEALAAACSSMSIESRNRALKQRHQAQQTIQKRLAQQQQQEAAAALRTKQKQRYDDIEMLPREQRRKAEEKLARKAAKKRVKTIKA